MNSILIKIILKINVRKISNNKLVSMDRTMNTTEELKKPISNIEKYLLNNYDFLTSGSLGIKIKYAVIDSTNNIKSFK